MSLSLVLLSVKSSFAIAPFEVNANGTTKTITVPANFSGTTVSAYLISRGNVSEYVSLTVSGPDGAFVTTRSAPLRKKNIAQVLSEKTWAPGAFVTWNGNELASVKLNGYQSSNLQTTAPVARAVSSNFCGDFPLEIVDNAISQLRSFGVIYTREEACQVLIGSGISPNSGGGTSSGGGSSSGGGTSNEPPTFTPGSSAVGTSMAIVRKDTCGTTAKDSYLVLFDIDVSKISEKERQSGYTIEVSARRIVHAGSRASTLKPVSEGKFAPRALFLLSATGAYGQEQLNIVRWSRGLPSVRRAKVEDYVYYRGLTLARSVAEPFLRGGKATVEIQSRAGLYSVCFSLTKSRQRVNGYRN